MLGCLFTLQLWSSGSGGRTARVVSLQKNSDLRLLNIVLFYLIIRWPTGAAIILSVCGMQPSVFQRLEQLNGFI